LKHRKSINEYFGNNPELVNSASKMTNQSEDRVLKIVANPEGKDE